MMSALPKPKTNKHSTWKENFKGLIKRKNENSSYQVVWGTCPKECYHHAIERSAPPHSLQPVPIDWWMDTCIINKHTIEHSTTYEELHIM